MIALLETGITKDGAHKGMYTELAILYSKYVCVRACTCFLLVNFIFYFFISKKVSRREIDRVFAPSSGQIAHTKSTKHKQINEIIEHYSHASFRSSVLVNKTCNGLN